MLSSPDHAEAPGSFFVSLGYLALHYAYTRDQNLPTENAPTAELLKITVRQPSLDLSC